MKKTILGITLLCVSMVFSLAADSKVLAKVDSEKIKVQDLKDLISASGGKLKYETLTADIREKALNQLIDKKLLYKYAKKNKIDKTKEFKKSMNLVKKEIMIQTLLSNKMDKMKIKNSDIKKFYNDNKTTYFSKPAEAKARHILLKEEKEAKDVIKTLKKISKSKLEDKFISLAKEKSQGPSSVSGGELGWFSAGKMVPEFSKAAFALKVGGFTKTPVKTQFGYHVIYLEDKKSSNIQNFSDVKENIKKSLQQQKFTVEIQSILKKLRDKAKITIY